LLDPRDDSKFICEVVTYETHNMHTNCVNGYYLLSALKDSGVQANK